MGFFVYADNAATTKLSQKADLAMAPFLSDDYGNPSGPYSLAREAASAVEDARKTVADCIGAQPNEIIFTSGGTESDNVPNVITKGTAYMELKSALSRGSIIQANGNAPETWTGCVLIVDEIKNFGVKAFLRIPAAGDAYICLRANQFDILSAGKAVLIPED